MYSSLFGGARNQKNIRCCLLKLELLQRRLCQGLCPNSRTSMDACEAFSLLASAGRSGLPFLLKPVWISDLNLLAETHLGLRLHQSNTRQHLRNHRGFKLPLFKPAGSAGLLWATWSPLPRPAWARLKVLARHEYCPSSAHEITPQGPLGPTVALNGAQSPLRALARGVLARC